MGLGSLSEAQFTRCNTGRLIAPAPGLQAMKSGHLRPELRVSLGPPASAPPPPPPPPPSAPRFRLLGAQRGGERERPSPLTLPALGGGTAPLTFPHPPPLGLASLLLFRPPSPRAQSPLFSSSGCRHAWTPCRAADLPVSRLGSVPTPHDTALRSSSPDRGDEAAPTRPFSPPLIRNIARGLQRRASGSRGSPYPDSSPSPWGTRSCRTGRSWDSWLREGPGRGRPSSRAFSFPGASWREAAAAATTQAAATAAGARELASASALLPLINTAGRRGCTGAGTRRGRGQGRARAARFPGDVGLRGGGFRGGRRGRGRAPRCVPRVPRAPALSGGRCPQRARRPGTPWRWRRRGARLAAHLGRPGCGRRANPSHPSRVGLEPSRTPDWIHQIRGLSFVPVDTWREPADGTGSPCPAPQLASLPPHPFPHL